MRNTSSSLEQQTPPFWGNGSAMSPYGRGGLHTENIQAVAREAQATGHPQHFDANGTVLRVEPTGNVELVLPGDADKLVEDLRAAAQRALQQ
jgi:hypothetical protein